MTVRLLTNIGRLWTGSEVWSNAAILAHDDRIAWVGPASDLPASIPGVIQHIVLGANAVPPEFVGRRSDSVEGGGSWCAGAGAAGADSIDAYCGEGGFTAHEASWVLNGGRGVGLLPRVHACDGRAGAALLAAE